jgi:phage terminase large subunit-like protein
VNLRTPGEALALMDAAMERRIRDETLQDEAARLARSFPEFIRAAWPIVVPARFVPTWHIDTIAEHIQAAYDRELPRLLITIQPGSLKSTIVSVLAPAWQWTHRPQERILSASHSDDLATRDTRRSRLLMQTDWYRSRWPDWDFSGDENLKTRYSNNLGGHRIRTHVGGGTGDRGNILILDDPHNATEAWSATQLQAAAEWWSDTWASRLDDSVEARGVKIVIGQRLHQDDLIGHILTNDEDAGRWVHLCLPAEYEAKHPFVYPASRTLPSGRTVQGDIRTADGELLAPSYMDAERLADRTAEMTATVYAGQYQQRPSPREGGMLKRANWRYYNPEDSFYARQAPFTAAQAALALPRFQMIVTTWDTSLKDRAKSDYVSGQVWGIDQANRWLLRLYHQRAGLNATIDAMLTVADWTSGVWPNVPQRIVIETAANGADAIAEIRNRVQGVIAFDTKGSKEQRAEAAAPALDGRNCLLPGYPTPEGDTYDSRTPADVQTFIEELAAFNTGTHDDQVDAWSMMVNWTRKHGRAQGRASMPRGAKPRPSALPA